jgi:DNA-binding HxlR family transcriptional regulator
MNACPTELKALTKRAAGNSRCNRSISDSVEYSLTEYGRSLKRALRAICDWSRIHMARIGADLR